MADQNWQLSLKCVPVGVSSSLRSTTDVGARDGLQHIY
jgi:hypothetical protein